MKGHRIAWSAPELAFIKRRKTWERRRLHAAFVKKFKRSDVRLETLCSLCKRNGWLTGPRAGRGKGRLLVYTKAEIAFLRRRQKLPRRQLYAEFGEAFHRPDFSFEKFISLIKRLGLRNGRDGCFRKGHVPWTKGKKLPFNANRAKTQWKKGQQPHNTKFTGHERVASIGYVMVSVNETNPHTGYERRYVLKHRHLWEQKHGPIPDGMALKCKGDKLNPDPSNWELVPRAMLPRLNGKSGRGYHQAPDDLKPTIMAVAKLEHRVRQKQRGAA